MDWPQFCFWLTLILTRSHLSIAQTISTTTPVPPLQWINLTDAFSGPRPPPLKDAAMGYDETSRSLIIFGGESSGGFPQSQTYILRLDSMEWRRPTPPPNLQRTPSARSSAISGIDRAASNRHGFVVVGGKGGDGRPLSDVWEFDFINQFWSPVNLSPGGPSARWGASGGIDFRTPPEQDPIVPGPNNTFYLSGGYDGSRISNLNDLWKLHISGTLSSNLPDNAAGSWERVSMSSSLPRRASQGSAVVGDTIVAVGGCDTASADRSCADQSSYVIDADRRQAISPEGCPAPRFSPTLVPNTNPSSPSFSSQSFLLLGTFNSSLWDDDGGINRGEVGVLDTNTGSWSRVIPAGDPNSSGRQTYPGPREGASAVTFSSSLVGTDRNISSDTIVFGGRDASGRYLSEVWLLRAYFGELTSSSQTWTGFGDGQLQTGPNANGAGVSVTYLTKCATALVASPSPSSTSSGSPEPTDSPAPTAPAQPQVFAYDTSVIHKLLSPLSLAIFQIAFLALRQTAPWFNPSVASETHFLWTYISVFAVIVAYGVGVAGLATSFTSISSTMSVVRRSDESTVLKTLHGQLGLAFFLALYGLIPLLVLSSTFVNRSRGSTDSNSDTNTKGTFAVVGEKNGPHSEPISRPQSEQNVSPPASPRPRVNSWGPSTLWQRSTEGRLSDDNESLSSAGPHRTFEVLNRPSRGQRSKGWLSVPLSEHSGPVPRNLSDIDWLQRRRSLNAVGELDYALSQVGRPTPSTPHTMDALVPPVVEPQISTPFIPSPFFIIIHVLLQVFFLALSIITLVALWWRAPRAGFAVFLAWIVIFYAIMFFSAWRGYPERSIISGFLLRLRTDPRPPPSSLPSVSPTPQYIPSGEADQFPFPAENRGPYVHHQPPYHVTPSDYSQAPRSVETDDDPDDDEDEDTRQRRMEEEMGRRDVSIVTVPRRKLWITNPS